MSEVEGSAPAQSAEAVPAAAAPVAPSATAARGVTSVSDEVVEKIAGTVAREVPGVADLGGDLARFFASVKEKVGLGEVGDDSDRGVSAKVEGNRAVVNVVIVIESGYVVHEVTEAVRVKVIVRPRGRRGERQGRRRGTGGVGARRDSGLTVGLLFPGTGPPAAGHGCPVTGPHSR
jgi:uncharacterized alkaline shock family protein YloU